MPDVDSTWHKRMSGPRLRWGGNVEAQRQAEKAYNKLRNKKRPKKTKRQKRRARQKTDQHRKQAAARKSWYAKYLQSPWWKRRRKQAIDDAGGKCSVCGDAHRIRVHHLHYKRVGAELPTDLQVLCTACHDRLHRVCRPHRLHPIDAAAQQHLQSIMREPAGPRVCKTPNP